MQLLRHLQPKHYFSTMQTPPRKVFSIEGNIGSGKSTLLRALEKDCKHHFLKEPLIEWQSINGDPKLNILSQFYLDPKRWAFTFQSYAFYTRLRHWKQVLDSTNGTIIAERSIQSDKQIFALNGYKQQLFNELEFALYNNYYDWLVPVDEIFAHKVNQHYIYLRVDPAIALERIKLRARPEEKDSISLEYIQQLHERHEEWLNQHEQVLILDGNREFEKDSKREKELIDQIHAYIE